MKEKNKVLIDMVKGAIDEVARSMTVDEGEAALWFGRAEGMVYASFIFEFGKPPSQEMGKEIHDMLTSFVAAVMASETNEQTVEILEGLFNKAKH